MSLYQSPVDDVAPRITRIFKFIKFGLSFLLIGAVFIGISMTSLKTSEQTATQNAQVAIYNAELQASSILSSNNCQTTPTKAICLQAEEIINNPTKPVEPTQTQERIKSLVAFADDDSTIPTGIRAASATVCENPTQIYASR